jgi:hypothetical protein
MSFQRDVETVPQGVDGSTRIIERTKRLWFEPVEAPGATGADWCPGSEARGKKALPFQPFERRVNRSRCNGAAEPGLHLPKYRPSIGVVTQSENSKENRLFEGAKSLSHQLRAYIVDIQ